MDPIEAVADAIMSYGNWEASREHYQNRNPGHLRDSPYATGHDDKGYAKFAGLVEGYTALCADLRRKFSGRSEHGLNGDSTLLDLMRTYTLLLYKNEPYGCAGFVSAWVSVALRLRIYGTTSLREIAPEVCGPAPIVAPELGE